MKQDEADWVALNGYADGMLGEAEARALEARLAGDAGLRGELERIRSHRAHMRRLRPRPGGARYLASGGRPRRLAAAGLAAALAGAVLLGALFVVTLGDAGWVERAEALHRQLSDQAYVVEEDGALPVVSTRHSLLEFRAPDLTASRLFLVDARVAGGRTGETVALHYRGMRGCRLTIVAIEAETGEDAAPVLPAGLLARLWERDGFHFAVIAEGMDADRFASVADYAETAIAQTVRSRDGMRTAMAERYRTARPCSAA
jgi:anti-sigma factor RsiW